jgi:hypothetical protein
MKRNSKIAGREIFFDFLELVQQLFEPELVSLMNDDEQHLVVLSRSGARVLERQQRFQIEIVSVGQRRQD